jgi:hypothetical protein
MYEYNTVLCEFGIRHQTANGHHFGDFLKQNYSFHDLHIFCNTLSII